MLFMKKIHTILYKYFFIVLTISISVAIIGLYSSYKFTELVMVKQVNKTSIEQLEQVRSVFNSLHSSNIPAAVQLSKDSAINDLMFSRSVNKSDVLKALSRLDTAKLSNPLISSIIVYNHLTSRFYSTNDGISEKENFHDKQLIEMLDNTQNYGLYRYIPRINDKNETVFTLLTGIMPTSGNSLKGALITNISERALRSLLTNSTSKLAGELIIYDRTGLILSHPKQELFSQRDKESPYIDELIDDSSERGTFVFFDGKKKMLLTYIRYSDFGWIFVTLTPYKDILYSVYTARNRVLTVLIFMLILSFVISIIVSRYLYEPIGIIRNFAVEVDSEYCSLQQTSNLSNELEYVDAVFHSLHQKTLNLNNTVNKNQMRNKRFSIRNLILSGDYEDLLHVDGPFRIIVLQVDNSMDQLLHVKSLNFFDVLEKMCKEIDSEFPNSLPSVIIEPNQIVCIQYKDQDTLTHKFSKFTLFQENNLKIEFSIGIGKYVESMDEAPLSYQQGLEAVKDRFKYGSRSIIFYRDLVFHTDRMFQYSEELNKKIIVAVKSGLEDEAIYQLRLMLEDIKMFCYEDFLLMSRILVYQFQNNFKQCKYPQGAHVLTGIRAKVNYFETILEFEKSITEVITTIVHEVLNANVQKTNELIIRAKEIIDENIFDCSLCSKWLSSKLEVSTNYLRTIFRDFQGSSISEYINGERINHGKILLETTDIPVKELYLKIGFSNYNYFFTIFKKYTSITPVQYKRAARNNKVQD